MSVSLTKGQTVSLTKSGGGELSQVRMGLGWDAITKRGMFGGTKQVSVDLDASALLLSTDRKVVDIVYFGQLRSKDGSITHTGDNRTGKGDGDDESILVDLPRVPATVAHIVFVVNSYTGENFSQIENAVARAVDSVDRDKELVRYELSGSGTHTAVVMARLSRSGSGWTFTAIGTPGEGRTADQLVPLALASV
ncbi:TerD family protein [Nakamurella flavida]|uniref:TerD family protein n=1 Tax=Nakamurella flavida TaxID=363630 RepID=A0A938YPA3_9ACTN|nr:TerD family protein [Nakamurella flavida]MBM9478211.1 TerD family protein [Nakamurella flavida]MDP9778567.1 tellurium resistance protein TerZ [Nakamurella flavida]